MKLYKVEAIVIRSRIYGEADRLLTFFTRERGKVPAVARGARKPSSRLRGAVQLFSRSYLLLHAGRTLDTVSQGEVLEDFSYLQEDLGRFGVAGYCAELADRLTLERHPLEEVFRCLLEALRALRRADPELVARAFEVKLLAALGYKPRLEGCAGGNHPGWQPPEQGGEGVGPVAFSVEKGGVLCPACASQLPGVFLLAPATLGVLSYFLRAPLGNVARVRVPPHTREELAQVLEAYLAYHGEVRAKARDFLREIEEE